MEKNQLYKISEAAPKNCVCVPCEPFKPKLIFVREAGAQPSGAAFSLLALLTKIKTG
jgi:hypothetical protein